MSLSQILICICIISTIATIRHQALSSQNTKLKSVESIELSQTRLFANNVNLMSIKFNANFITETLNDSIGTGYDYFITLEDTILSLTKNTENIAKYDGLIKTIIGAHSSKHPMAYLFLQLMKLVRQA